MFYNVRSEMKVEAKLIETSMRTQLEKQEKRFQEQWESFRRSRSESKAGLERTNLQLRNQVERVAQDAARQHETDIGEHYRRKHSFVAMETTLGEQLKRLQSKLNGSPSPHEL